LGRHPPAHIPRSPPAADVPQLLRWNRPRRRQPSPPSGARRPRKHLHCLGRVRRKAHDNTVTQEPKLPIELARIRWRLDSTEKAEDLDLVAGSEVSNLFADMDRHMATRRKKDAGTIDERTRTEHQARPRCAGIHWYRVATWRRNLRRVAHRPANRRQHRL